MKGYQILITPEMAKAGVDALLGFDTEDLRYSEPELIVRLIYQEMDAARPPGYVTKQLEALRREFEEQEEKLCPS